MTFSEITCSHPASPDYLARNARAWVATLEHALDALGELERDEAAIAEPARQWLRYLRVILWSYEVGAERCPVSRPGVPLESALDALRDFDDERRSSPREA